ncbi:Protein of unknown function [Pyronema omphalodes CBS 100304]|uniref:Uncharacterized protein n=1 Tax=Pyronema omphalodes (strain CBS 100304) TaxID=1076935 RepID=U4L9G1_PYROM|nr:Protein of unknown function [Pyronema omphalodes CBS 100304]
MKLQARASQANIYAIKGQREVNQLNVCGPIKAR